MAHPNHAKRIKLMQDLFACTFTDSSLHSCLEHNPEDTQLGGLIRNLDALDAQISTVAPERPLDQINKVDLAILRQIVFESKNSDTPIKVLLDEGVELAKEFGSETSPKFINGVLAKLLLPEEK